MIKLLDFSVYKSSGRENEANHESNVMSTDFNTRWSAKGEGQYLILQIQNQNERANAIRISWYGGIEKNYHFEIQASEDDLFYTTIYKGRSSGNTNAFEEYSLDETVSAQYFKVMVHGNNRDEHTSIKSILIVYDEKPLLSIADRTVKRIAYPPPKVFYDPQDRHFYRRVRFDSDIASKNYCKSLSALGKLPLIDKKDTYGFYYSNIPILLKLLDITDIGIKDYDYNKEKTRPYENNNRGDEEGLSLRLDMQKCFMPQFEYTITLLNKAILNDQISLKYGGNHTNPPKDVNADCLIVRLLMDGTEWQTQLEPSHMAPSPWGYGDLFNIVSTQVGNTRARRYSYRFIVLKDVPTKRTFIITAVDGTNNNSWDLEYLSVIHDGMGGKRALKDPLRQWVYTGRRSLKDATITIRFDAQPERIGSDTYDNARITEIVDYE